MENLTSSGSQTAKLAAAYRARATERERPVCNDPWARYLAGEDASALLHKGDSVVPEMELGVALRTAWLDEQVRRSHATQVVILGAGLDTRAARLRRRGLRFFEVDHPATQAYKRAALEGLPDYPRDAATFVPCDLEREDFAEALITAGFRADEPSMVIWEGVTAYLTEDAMRSTLRQLRSPTFRQAGILFDYVGKAKGDGVSRVAAEMGEPFLFTTNDIRPLLSEEGFARADVACMVETCRERTGTVATGAPFFDRWFLAHVPAQPASHKLGSSAVTPNDRGIALVAPHCDLVERLRLVPPSAQVRGVYIRSIDTQLAMHGQLGAYREIFPDDAHAAMSLYPLADYLVRLACAGALVVAPDRLHEGMFMISKGNAKEFMESLLGRVMLKGFSRDPVRMTEQGVAARRQSFTYGHWEIRKHGEHSLEVVHKDEYRWLESAVAGAAKGMVEACGVTAEVETKLINRFNGSTFIRW